MIPSIWQWAGNGTPLADTVPARLNCADVICVGATGKLVRFARLVHAPAGSESAVAAEPAGAPSTVRHTPIKILLPKIVMRRCQRWCSGVIGLPPGYICGGSARSVVSRLAN